jgi:hypothetical protein
MSYLNMNPSLSSINQNLLMTSDFFLVPTSPDYFSVMAIDSLTSVLPRWRVWAQQAAAMRVLQDATYPFPATTPRFLGTVVQKYRIRDRSTAQLSGQLGTPSSGKPAEGFQKWISDINGIIGQVRRCCGHRRALANQAASSDGIGAPAWRDFGFNSLMAVDTDARVPLPTSRSGSRRSPRAYQKSPDMFTTSLSARRYRPGPNKVDAAGSMDQALRV